MKTLKKAQQKNVNVDLDFYYEHELKNLFNTYNCMACVEQYDENGSYERTTYVYDWNGYFEGCYEMRLAGKLGYDEHLPVHLFIEDQIKEIKVVCVDGYYHAVAVMNDGGQVYITL